MGCATPKLGAYTAPASGWPGKLTPQRLIVLARSLPAKCKGFLGFGRVLDDCGHPNHGNAIGAFTLAARCSTGCCVSGVVVRKCPIGETQLPSWWLGILQWPALKRSAPRVRSGMGAVYVADRRRNTRWRLVQAPHGGVVAQGDRWRDGIAGAVSASESEFTLSDEDFSVEEIAQSAAVIALGGKLRWCSRCCATHAEGTKHTRRIMSGCGQPSTSHQTARACRKSPGWVHCELLRIPTARAWRAAFVLCLCIV
jgi:hypothetical protein